MSDIMSRAVVTVPPGRVLADAVGIMANRVISCLVVAETTHPLGIMSERDIVRRVVAADRPLAGLTVADVMTTRYRRLDLRCAELLQQLHRILREARAPLAEMRASGEELEAATRALEEALGLGRDDAQRTREAFRHVEDTLRRIGEQQGLCLDALGARLRNAGLVVDVLLAHDDPAPAFAAG